MQRNGRLARRIGFLATLAVAVLVVGSYRYRSYLWKPGRTVYQTAYAQGEKEADDEIAGGAVTLYTAGLLGRPIPNVDGETGFPLRAVAGCDVNDEIIGRIRGHNERVNKLLAAGRPVSNSYKTWIGELNDLVRYHEGQSQLVQPVRLVAGGPYVASPDGRFKVLYAPPPGSRSPALLVAGADETNPRLAIRLGPAADTRELIWGPKDSPFCVVRSQLRDGDENYQAYDLTNGLNIFPSTRVRDARQYPLFGPGDP